MNEIGISAKGNEMLVEAQKKKQETYLNMKSNSAKQTAVDGSPKRQ